MKRIWYRASFHDPDSLLLPLLTEVRRKPRPLAMFDPAACSNLCAGHVVLPVIRFFASTRALQTVAAEAIEVLQNAITSLFRELREL